MNISKVIKTILISVIIICLDQLTKIKVVNYFINSNYDLLKINSYFNIVLVYNKGITFGSFNNLRYGSLIFSLIAFATIIYLLIWLKKNEDKNVFIALNLIIAGAIGNLIDRVRLGAVIDFLDFHYKQYHWYSFNIADSCICLGVAILLIKNLDNENKIKEG